MTSAQTQQIVHWQAPSAMTHATWQQAHAECQALSQSNTTDALTIDWQRCEQVDSSALAFILDLKRNINKPIHHHQVPIQLVQLAKLYEVENVLGL